MGLIKTPYTDKETIITAESMNNIQDAIIALEDGLFTIDNDKSGEIISITDAAKRGFRSLNIYGKTTQDGTPTPDAPVDLVSVGDAGDVKVKLYGKNIAESTYINGEFEQYNTVFYIDTTLSPSTAYTLSFRGTIGNGYYANEYVFERAEVAVKDGTTTVVLTTKSTLNRSDYPQYYPGRGWLILKNSKKNSAHEFSSVMLSLGTSAKEYEAPKGKQTLTVSTSNGLPGIPVSSGGNYTDSNGQQWVCDEIDLARGAYVQRCVKQVFDGTENWRLAERDESIGKVGVFYLPMDRIIAGSFALCNRYQKATGSAALQDAVWKFDTGHTQFRINAIDYETEADDWMALLREWYAQGNPLVGTFILSTPIETPLSEEELAAYASLHTYKDNTTVSNDAGAYMDLEYVMDAKKYIDSLVTGGIAPARVE